jgi:hypothetical protein
VHFAHAKESLTLPLSGLVTKAGFPPAFFIGVHRIKKRLQVQAFDENEGVLLKSATRTRQAEELTRLTRRVAIRGPLPSDQPTG